MDDKPDFDEVLAKSYIGNYILIGITYQDSKGNETSTQQLHGIIKSASKQYGLNIELHGAYKGETWDMPPDLRSVTEADPGTYSLHSTGEQIENPDLLCTWVVEGPDE